MIRRLLETDLPRAAELERQCFSEPWSEAALGESLKRPEYLFLAAQEGDRVAAYGGLYRTFDEGNITNIAVDREFRGRGVGTELMRRLLEEGEALGICAFTLEVRVGNAAAIRMYEKLGFVSCGVRPGFYRDPAEDALIMWRR
ncbi:MAG: ribosomal protein S18-alanine N-acetyltransferase [Eubacteriales bacterium]|nr:ribosomal protein S18-alanine N-acetyltransferase [Eubacteriales bacterium]